MSRHKKLMTVCCAAVLTLGLAACGGGGGGDRAQTSPPDMPTMPTPEPESHVCDDGASQACVDARQAELDALGDDATVAELRAAEKALTDAQMALADHNTATMENTTVSGLIDDAMMAIADIDEDSTPNEVAAGRAAIKAAQDSLDGMENLYAADETALQGRIDALNEAYNPIEMAVNTAEATRAALTKETAISMEAAQATDATVGGSDATIGTSEGNYEGPAISRDNDGTTITVTVHGATDDDDETFMKAEDLTHTAEGHAGQMLTRTMDADADGNVVTEVAIVYTDIEAPTPTAFAEVTGQALNARDLDDTVDADEDGTATNDFTALTVDQTSADVLALIGSPSFAPGTGSSTQHTFTFDDTNTDDMDEADEVAGTYNGAMGTYRCNGTAVCTVTVDDEGMVTAMSDGWVFTPDAGAMSDVPDADYLHYGAWLQRTTDSDGEVTYNEVETFAGSSIAASGDITAVSGIAEYEGGAAGVYVHKTFAGDGTSEATSGHFTADASLTAYFSGGATPAGKADTLEGTINNFVLSGGEANSWSVTLQSDGDPNTDGIQPDTDGIMAGTASGGVTGQDGSFTATFHGSVAETGTPPAVPQPTAVVGEFNSVFSNGSVAGGFGARKQ